MPKNSKYSDKKINDILSDMITVLEKHKAPTDLSLMVLGNLVTNLLHNNFSPEQQKQMAAVFANALEQSLESTKSKQSH